MVIVLPMEAYDKTVRLHRQAGFDNHGKFMHPIRKYIQYPSPIPGDHNRHNFSIPIHFDLNMSTFITHVTKYVTTHPNLFNVTHPR